MLVANKGRMWFRVSLVRRLILAVLCALMLGSSCDDPPGDGFVFITIQNNALRDGYSELGLHITEVAVFYDDAPEVDVTHCEECEARCDEKPRVGRCDCRCKPLCDTSGAYVLSVDNDLRVNLAALGEAGLASFAVPPGNIREIRLFVDEVTVTVDGRVISSRPDGDHKLVRTVLSCKKDQGPFRHGRGRGVLRLTPEGLEPMTLRPFEQLVTFMPFDPNTDIHVLKDKKIKECHGRHDGHGHHDGKGDHRGHGHDRDKSPGHDDCGFDHDDDDRHEDDRHEDDRHGDDARHDGDDDRHGDDRHGDDRHDDDGPHDDQHCDGHDGHHGGDHHKGGHHDCRRDCRLIHVLKLAVRSNYSLTVQTDAGVATNELMLVAQPNTPIPTVDADVVAYGASIVSPSYYDRYRVRLPGGVDIRDAVAHFEGLSWVRIVAASEIVSVAQIRPAGETISAPQETAMLPDGWQRAVNAVTTGVVGDYRPVIAVIDTGISIRNQDLAPNLWLNPGEIGTLGIADADADGFITLADIADPVNAGISPGDLNGNGYLDGDDLLQSATFADGIDQDGNCFTDDILGWDFVNNDNDPTGGHYHGTGVAGIVAGAVNGGGTLGATHNARIAGIRIFDNAARTSNGAITAALQYAQSFGLDAVAGNDINIANGSFGSTWVAKGSGDGCSGGCYVTRAEGEFTEIVNRRIQEMGFLATPVAAMPNTANPTCTFTPMGMPNILWVFSAGNEAANIDSGNTFGGMVETAKTHAPNRTVGVASVNQTLGRSSFSNVGATLVDVAAPGETWTLVAIGDNTPTIAPASCPGTRGPVNCDGTSFSAPMAAGALGLLISLDPTLAGDPVTLRQRLLDGTPNGVSGAAVIDGNFLNLDVTLQTLGY